MTSQEQLLIRISNGLIRNFFDILSDILLKISGGNLYKHKLIFNKHFSPYMLCRYLSMRQTLLPYSLLLNQLQTTLNYEQFYRLAYKIVPRQSSGYIKYISKNKLKKLKSANNLNLINIDNNDVKMSIFDL